MKKLIFLIITGVLFAQLSQETVVTSIRVLQDNRVEVETATIVTNGDQVIAQKSNYYVLTSDMDISGETERVKKICNAVWQNVSAVPDRIYIELQLLIDEAPDLYYTSTRSECVNYVQSIVKSLKAGDKTEAVKTIDYLILNQAKYFYKSYNRRTITVARFETIKRSL